MVSDRRTGQGTVNDRRTAGYLTFVAVFDSKVFLTGDETAEERAATEDGERN